MLRLFQRIKQRTPARPTLTVPSGAVVALQSGQACSLHAAAGWRLRIESGSLWVTEAGDQVDHYLTDADLYVIRKQGLVVIESLGSATVRFRMEPDVAPAIKPVRAQIKAPRPETRTPQTPPDEPYLAARWRGPSSV